MYMCRPLKALIIGNLTIDIVDGSTRLGGPGLYGGIALRQLGDEVYVYSSISREYLDKVKRALDTHKINLVGSECSSMPTFIIRGGKVRGLEKQGCSIDVDNVVQIIDTIKPDIIILSPVLGEIDVNTISKISIHAHRSNVKVVSLDIQGLVRRLIDNTIVCSWSDDIWHVLQYVDVVHGNIQEFCFSDNEKNILRIAFNELKMRRSSSTLLLSLDRYGCYLVNYVENKILHVPAPPVNVVDDVGAGDVMTAVTSHYIAKGFDIINATVRGVIAASLKVENAHRDRWFDNDVIERLSPNILKSIRILNLQKSF